MKTMTVHKVYGMSVITALTAQNTTGVYGIMNASPDFVGNQLDCIFSDIVPDAVKIGMVSNTEIIDVVADKLKGYQARNIVLDPLMIATSGAKLLDDDAMKSLIDRLFSIADMITPNLYEAELISGISIKGTDDMLKAAKIISEIFTGNILIKGGHLTDTADDLLYANKKAIWISGERVNNPNTHGTGCTLSSSIACFLARGFNPEESTRKAKEYLTGALKAGLNLGAGSGPLNHMYDFTMDSSCRRK
jgi:hydroxymethylpyrimidine/phosphomethylpyrimidine kinase